MNKFFLYRLFKESKIFFLFSIFFMLGYAVALSKQMDMLFFPLNSMFSDNTMTGFSTTTYAVKLNGKVVKITDDMYLKKDFSEGTLQVFSKWIKADTKDFMTELLKRKIIDSVKRKAYLDKLTPPKTTAQTWPIWFLSFHHIKINLGDNIAIWQYRFDLINKHFILKDSSLITKQTVIHE